MPKHFPTETLYCRLLKKIAQPETCTAQNVDAVNELVLNHENTPGTHRTSLDMHSRTRRTLGTSAVASTCLLD